MSFIFNLFPITLLYPLNLSRFIFGLRDSENHLFLLLRGLVFSPLVVFVKRPKISGVRGAKTCQIVHLWQMRQGKFSNTASNFRAQIILTSLSETVSPMYTSRQLCRPGAAIYFQYLPSYCWFSPIT